MRHIGHKFISASGENKTGGGVGIYVNENLDFKIKKNLSIFKEGKLESLFVEFKMHGKRETIIVGNPNRQPNGNLKEFEHLLEEMLSKNGCSPTKEQLVCLELLLSMKHLLCKLSYENMEQIKLIDWLIDRSCQQWDKSKPQLHNLPGGGAFSLYFRSPLPTMTFGTLVLAPGWGIYPFLSQGGPASSQSELFAWIL